MITLYCIRPKGLNIGNDAIHMAMQHFVYEAFGEVVNLVSLPATGRYENHLHAGLTPRTIHEINQYGHGVIVGGGNLYENGELDVNLDALESLHVPLMLFSLSHGRIFGRGGRLVARTDSMPQRTVMALDRRASFALARDEATGAYLRQIGCRQCDVGGCPTIFLDRVADRLPHLPDANRRRVLISIRNPTLMNVPPARQSRVWDDVAAMIDWLRREDLGEVALLCHDPRDIAFAASFPGVEYMYTGDVYTFLALLRACLLSVSYRLHAFLPCIAFGTPAIAITYDERAMSLIETVGLSDWSIDMLREPTLLNAVRDRCRRRRELDVIRAGLNQRFAGLYERVLGTFRQFAQAARSCAAEGATTARQAQGAVAGGGPAPRDARVAEIPAMPEVYW